MHWAEAEAIKLLKRSEEKQVLATAITPSGPIHLGNLREVLTADVILKELNKKNQTSELIFIEDNWDPLRKVYPYLDRLYEKYVGFPISEIPCPCNNHNNYAEHWFLPFVDACNKLGVQLKIYRANEMYYSGFYRDAIRIVVEKYNEIKDILQRVSKRKLPANWYPLNIKCEQCSRLTSTKVKKINYPWVEYVCDCGFKGKADLTQGGSAKLPWRIEWPARWKLLGVTFEACGKDHAAAGGAWHTGVELSTKIFGYPPPNNLAYEFVYLKGKGAMHSSTGIAVLPGDMLQVLSPEELRFYFVRQNPQKHLEFDPVNDISNLTDEWDAWERNYFGRESGNMGMKDIKKIYELSHPFEIPKEAPLKVPFRHLIVVAQLAADFEEALKILKRSGVVETSFLNGEITKLEKLKNRFDHAKKWLEMLSPPSVRFEVKKSLPEITLDKEEKKFLGEFKITLDKTEWNPESLHNAVYETSVNAKITPQNGFKIIYKILLGRTNGPRAGYFLSSLDKKFVKKRIEEAEKELGN
jgi:lysyl-tRNA synthetase class 1